MFKEKNIRQSYKPSYDANNNKSDVKRPFKNNLKSTKQNLQRLLPFTIHLKHWITAVQPKKVIEEIDVHTLSLLEGHDNYIDLAAWAPNDDTLVTASSDK